MNINHCLICGWHNTDKLCEKHRLIYVWEPKLSSYRLKKRCNGSRYTSSLYHEHEKSLTRILEVYFGKDDIITGVHPIWATSSKKVLLEYDICIMSEKILIEYQGEQHYNFPNFFHKTKKEFTAQTKRDKRKVKLAKKNGYKLVIIKYNEPLFKDYILNKILGE